MNANETWKPIPDFDGYEASDWGRIRSVPRTLPDGRQAGGKILAQRRSNRGYQQVNLRRDGQVKTVTVHRCVLLAHVGPPPPDRPFSRHHPDDDPANNNLSNLSWCSQEVNEQDKINREKRNGYVATPAEKLRATEVLDVNIQNCDAVTVQQQVIEVHSGSATPTRWARLRTKLRRWWDGA
jgi:NUMOD4 motif